MPSAPPTSSVASWTSSMYVRPTDAPMSTTSIATPVQEICVTVSSGVGMEEEYPLVWRCADCDHVFGSWEVGDTFAKDLSRMTSISV